VELNMTAARAKGCQLRLMVELAIVATFSLCLVKVVAQEPRSAQTPSDIDGLWLNDAMTPLVRPPGFTDRTFFTQAEARDYEADYGRRTRSRGGAVELELNSDEFEPGHLLPDLRTALIVDPPDGKVPALTARAQARATALAQRRQDHFADGPEDLNLSERCLLHLGGPPMMPMPQNNNVEIVQTSDYVMILNETNHEFRVIPLDGRPHLPSNTRQWKGDSRGRWDGKTLVVDTTNFTDQTTFNGSGTALHVIERFTRVDDGTLQYAFTVDDPESFVRSWSAVTSMSRSAGPLFEFACHEGDHSMENMLRGARFEDGAR
jgi:hypothetical protein